MSLYDIIIGGPCELCGFRHPGETCEEYREHMQRAARRIAKAIMSVNGPGTGFAHFRGACLRGDLPQGDDRGPHG